MRFSYANARSELSKVRGQGVLPGGSLIDDSLELAIVTLKCCST